MSDTDIKRLNNLTDELEQRVKKLETKKSDKEEIVTITENAENLLFKPTNDTKVFKFISTKKTFAVVDIEVLSPATFNAQFEMFVNGKQIKSQTITFPFFSEIPIKTIVGENVLKVVIYTSATTASFKLDLKLNITGNVVKKESNFRLGSIDNEMIYLVHNDSVKGINTNTMETNICYTNKDYATVGFLRGNYNVYLIKCDGVIKIEKHARDTNNSYATIDVSIDFTDCAIEITNGVMYIARIKGENVYLYIDRLNGKTDLVKLPYKAKNIKILNGTTGRYIYFVDLRGGLNVIKHYSYTSYKEEKIVSFRRE